jgi:hypothetical protein
MPVRSSERPTVPPAFDVDEFARSSDRRLVRAAPVEPEGAEAQEDDDADFPLEGETKRSEVRIATRPQWGRPVTNEAWARSLLGSPVVTMASESLKRLPLDHRAGFVISLMDGSIDLDTVIDLCGMEREEALDLVRDLYESGVVVFR